MRRLEDLTLADREGERGYEGGNWAGFVVVDVQEKLGVGKLCEFYKELLGDVLVTVILE